MSATKYTPVFSIQMTHTFFENNQCTCLQLKPTSETQKVMDRYGFKMQTTINGFKLYTSATSSLSDFLSYITNAMDLKAFEFSIHTTDENFHIFTETPVNWQGQFRYSSSDPKNTTEGKSIELHPTLSEEGGSLILGTIAIAFDDLIASSDGNPSYILAFTTRSTQWNYYVINQSNLQLNAPEINGNSTLEFSGPKNVTIANGQDALLFTSKKLIPLQQNSVYQFDLVNQPSTSNENTSATSTSKPTVLFKGLPNAGPAHFSIVNIDNKQVISSPMYIYI